MEQPAPDLDGAFGDNEEVLIDANPIADGRNENIENDPLDDIKPELVLVAINEDDRVELQRMLAERSANAESAVHVEVEVSDATTKKVDDNPADASASVREQENENVGENLADAAVINENLHNVNNEAAIADPANQNIDENTADADTINKNLENVNDYVAGNSATTSEQANDIKSGTAKCDDDIIFEDGDMPKPMGDFRHALVKHEDDDMSGDLCYKIVVS